MWQTTRHPNGDVHVIPRNDLIAHQPDGCPCGPSTEPVPAPDGSIGWLITHFSLDNRESKEAP